MVFEKAVRKVAEWAERKVERTVVGKVASMVDWRVSVTVAQKAV